MRCSPDSAAPPPAAPRALRSAPAQNALPAPVTTTACTSGSASARSTASRRRADIWSVKALRRSGSLTVMSATRASTRYRTESGWATRVTVRGGLTSPNARQESIEDPSSPAADARLTKAPLRHLTRGGPDAHHGGEEGEQENRIPPVGDGLFRHRRPHRSRFGRRLPQHSGCGPPVL